VVLRFDVEMTMIMTIECPRGTDVLIAKPSQKEKT